jgi:hypothetical protein
MDGHEARKGERRDVYRVLAGKAEGKRPLGRPRNSWEIILRWIFRKWDGGEAWTGLMWLRIRTGGDNEPSGSLQCGELLL